MSSESSRPSSREQRLHEIIADYLAAIEVGQAPDRADVLAGHPDLAAELEAFFTGHDRIQRVAGPMRLVAAGGQRPATVLEQPPLRAQGDGAIPASGTGGRPPRTIIEPQTIWPRPAVVPGPEPGLLPAFGDYELLAEIGRGGMGIVYQARQVSLNRLVALKMILAGGQAGPEELVRFRGEAETIARLHHPNIVQIHAVGEHKGRPYLVLEFIKGGSLSDQLDGTPWPPQQAARLAKKLAGAMQAVHEQGIVHRDLKPANVLLADEGLPKITDFGLAKRLDDAAGPTQTGAILGTPSYMAPEQAAGAASRRQAGAVRVGPAVDIYALGAILYELLTGRPPFKAATRLDTLLQVLADDPVPPRRLQSKVPRDLETICLKCLRKEPNERYTSGKALAEDLGRFLQGKPIVARPVGVVTRGVRWVRRRPAAATLLVIMALITLGVVAGGAWYLHEREVARRIDEEREKQREQVEQLAYLHLIPQIQRACQAKDYARAKSLLDQCPRRPRRWEYHYLSRLAEDRGGDKCRIDLPALAKAHVIGVAFTPDGKRLATIVSGGDETVNVWDVATGQPALTLRWDTSCMGAVFSPDGQRLALVSGGLDSSDRPRRGVVKVWDVASGRETRSIIEDAGLNGRITFSPDGKRLASYSFDKTVKVWDVASGRETLSIKDDAGPGLGVAFSPDGKRLASMGGRSDRPYEVKVWDAATGQEILSLKGHTGYVSSVAFSPDGKRLASGGLGPNTGTNYLGEVKVWDLATGQENLTLKGHTIYVSSVAFSPDGKRLATSGDHTVRVWDAQTGEGLVALPGTGGGVGHVIFSPDGNLLVALNPFQVWNGTPLE
jgi:DNA-binding beta-propeller fold protein YncE